MHIPSIANTLYIPPSDLNTMVCIYDHRLYLSCTVT